MEPSVVFTKRSEAEAAVPRHTPLRVTIRPREPPLPPADLGAWQPIRFKQLGSNDPQPTPVPGRTILDLIRDWMKAGPPAGSRPPPPIPSGMPAGPGEVIFNQDDDRLGRGEAILNGGIQDGDQRRITAARLKITDMVHAASRFSPEFKKLKREMVSNFSEDELSLARRRYEEDLKGLSGSDFATFGSFLNTFWSDRIVQHLLLPENSEIAETMRSSPNAIPALNAIKQLFETGIVPGKKKGAF